ncbi:hypothetical protein [Nocardioides solisilvae]|uniref:hypothetical protein n=1 Tax=Nocardioides solisilvae TaxID=1542435 RepID=UPI000D7505D6|nr:hypothetical protein [Nocardioides solisilvae]
MRRRRLLSLLLTDLERGTHSVLEHGYTSRVVLPHGLPPPTHRQALRRGPRGREYRDVEHEDLGVIVELDGSRWHDDARAADSDARRDLDDLAAGQVVVRLRHPQVYGDPCGTAVRLGAVFRVRGWTGRLRRCGPTCSVAP